MSNLAERSEPNVPGRYYVDSTCIDCDLCREHAPDFFVRHHDLGLTYVARQPITAEEIALCEAAATGCPTESIGADGEG